MRVGKSTRVSHWPVIVLNLLLPLFCWLMPCGHAQTNPRSLFIRAPLATEYIAEVAEFGNPLDESVEANLMLPPDNPWLCEYPASLQNVTTNQIATEPRFQFDQNVALFVSIDRCSAETKARVVMELRQRISTRIRILLLYSTNSQVFEFIALSQDNVTAEHDFDDIGILHIPHRYASGIDLRMRMQYQGIDPRFSYEASQDWEFPIEITTLSPVPTKAPIQPPLPPPPRAVSLVEIIAQVFVLRDLESYLGLGQVTAEISGPGPYTAMTPWNYAFQKLDPALIAKLRDVTWGAHLQNLLRYHILDRDLPLSSLEETQNVTMANGQEVVITRLAGTSRVRVNGILVLATYNATNGFAYMLDEVLRPAWLDQTLLDVASLSFSTLASLLAGLEYESILSDSSESLTIFAPSNEAFDLLGQSVMNYLQSDNGSDTLEATLLYHMVPGGPLPSKDLVMGPLVTLLGSEIDVVVNGTVLVTGNASQANVVRADIVANNGLIHEIDNVLLLEALPIDQLPDTLPPTRPSTQNPTPLPTGIPVETGWRVTSGPFSGPSSGIGYGASVTMDGNLMATGAPNFSEGMGAVQTFEKVNGTWQITNTVYVTEAQAFGQAVDVSVGSEWSSMVIGAPRTFGTQFASLRFGSVHYLEMIGSQWSAVGEPLRPEATPLNSNGAFGAAVAVAANTRRIAIGGPSISLDASNLRNGQVFTYQYDGTSFVPLADPLDGHQPNDRFGSAVAMSADGIRLLVGAPGLEGSSYGSIFYFIWDQNRWRTILPLPGSTEDENLGTSVAIISADGLTIAMGAPNFDGGRGAVRVYRQHDPNSQFWAQMGQDIVGESRELLGTTLSGFNNRVVVGTAVGSFKVYDYDSTSSIWTQVDENSQPLTESPVVSIATGSTGDVAVGLNSENVLFYGLTRALSPVSTLSPTRAPVAAPTADSATSAPSITSWKTLLDLLCDSLEGNCDALSQADSPQNRAYQWLVENAVQSFSDDALVIRYALATLYFGTGYEFWVDTTNWLSADLDVCIWYAVICDQNGNVIELLLTQNDLSGNIPPEIGLFHDLIHLNLQGNNLDGTIPPKIGELSKLSKLDLSRNGLEGTLSSQIGLLTTLEQIHIQNNRLSGQVPSALAILTNIREIWLQRNKLSGTIPSEIGFLRNLVSLDLRYNNFVGQIPSEIGHLAKNLVHLDLSDNNLVGQIPSEIGQLLNLTHLELSSNNLSGPLPQELFNLIMLQNALGVHSNRLAGSLSTRIGLLTNLERLYVNDNLLSGNIPSELAKLTKMRAIRLDDNLFTGVVPRDLCALYSIIQPWSFADCDELAFADCFLWCCSDGTCTCRLQDTPDLNECFAAP